MKYPLKICNSMERRAGRRKYRVLRKGTERPHSGTYNLHYEEGTYCCGACSEPLFESNSKFDAHCGWPSLTIQFGKVKYVLDKTHGMTRTEIVCANCGSHLGHLMMVQPLLAKGIVSTQYQSISNNNKWIY
jgi:peptide-methionine (R)-S-oxide reductase